MRLISRVFFIYRYIGNYANGNVAMTTVWWVKNVTARILKLKWRLCAETHRFGKQRLHIFLAIIIFF